MTKKKLDYISDSIANFNRTWNRDLGLQSGDLMRMHMACHDQGFKGTLVEFFKSKLGRQSYTWVGYSRKWVWETPDWRVYVNNNDGIALELRYDLSLTEARAAWEDFAAKLGFEP